MEVNGLHSILNKICNYQIDTVFGYEYNDEIDHTSSKRMASSLTYILWKLL